MQRSRKDTYDMDPDTASMYDDQWAYGKAGKMKGGNPMAGITGKVPLPTPEVQMGNPESAPGNLMQSYRGRRDTFDMDPDTASMYDDGWVYGKPGKFKGGNPMAGITGKVPLPTPEVALGNPDSAPGNLMQSYRGRKDTYDMDPDTASMYDDQWVYGKAGKFKSGNPMAGITGKVPLPTPEVAMGNPESAPGNLMQAYRGRKDTYDMDPDTASMYDDQWAYGKAGKMKGGNPMAGITGKVPLPTPEVQMGNPESAPGNLMQWPSVARCADGKTSTDFEACDHMNNQEM
jgi:hypothetical protein